MKKLTAMLVMGVVLALSTGNAWAGCGGCGGGAGHKHPKKTAKKTALSAAAVDAALAKLTLTDAQKAKIEAARVSCKTSTEKACKSGCKHTSARGQAKAAANYLTAVKLALTPDQQKALDAALAAK